jgi:hypothetical protein
VAPRVGADAGAGPLPPRPRPPWLPRELPLGARPLGGLFSRRAPSG